MKKSYDILLVGVGGQGVLTMFKIIGNTAKKEGYNIIGAETHGMSQRGGSVYVHLRIGKNNLYSPSSGYYCIIRTSRGTQICRICEAKRNNYYCNKSY